MHIGWIGVLEALVGSVAKELHLQQTPKRNQNYYHQNTFLLLFFFENTFHFIYILVWLVLVWAGLINTMFLCMCFCYFSLLVWVEAFYLCTCLTKTLSRRIKKSMSAYCIYVWMYVLYVGCLYFLYSFQKAFLVKCYFAKSLPQARTGQNTEHSSQTQQSSKSQTLPLNSALFLYIDEWITAIHKSSFKLFACGAYQTD